MIGMEVGSYTITEHLASGGMGSVWIAKHSVMERPVVVKLLHASLGGDPEHVERFFNEARAAASIQDPGIVQVFDVGRLADGSPYLVMERLPGETLAARLKTRERRTLDRSWNAHVVQLLALVARTLAAAHAKGIVHRDLKPENIFVVPDPDVEGGERIKILDFGIAKLATGRPSQLTRAGSFFGTPAYMAPEQCTDAGLVDARADLYAVGCIAYEMLAGTPPFGEGGLELVAAQMRDEPPPLGARVPAAPKALVAIIERLLRKNPDDRFPSARELHAALENIDLDAASAVGSMPTVHATPAPVARAHRSRLPLVAAGALLVVGAVVAYVVMSRESGPAAAPATPTPVATAEIDARAAEPPRPPPAATPVVVEPPVPIDAAVPSRAAAGSADAPQDAGVDASPTPTPRPRPTKPQPRITTNPSDPLAPSPSPTTPTPAPDPSPTVPEPAPENPPPTKPAAPAMETRAIEAGPIRDGLDARKKCPKVCAARAKWTGAWRTTVRGKQSTCDCRGPAE